MQTLSPHLIRTRRSQAVADQLLSLISSGQIPPGTRLPTETELCEQFCVSRTTLREAVQTLRARGLLEVNPGRGSFAVQPNLKNLMRDTAFAIRLSAAPSPSPKQVANLQNTIFQQAVQPALRAPLINRQRLFQHIVILDAPAATNAELERAWQKHFLQLGADGQSILPEILLMLLQNLQQNREEDFQQAEEVSRTSHCQLRATTALVEGDATRLQAALTHWLENTPTLLNSRHAA